METAQNINQQQGTPTQPEENSSAEKMFTQEDVDRIVQERLAQERGSQNGMQQEDETTTRVADLERREAALSCREFILKGGYKEELLDILPTDNAEDFKTRVAKLIELVPHLDPNKKLPYFTAPISNAGKFGSGHEDLIASAFKPKF